MYDEKETITLKGTFIELEKMYIEELGKTNKESDSNLYISDLFKYKEEFSRSEICLKMTDRFFDMIDWYKIFFNRPSDITQVLNLVPKKFLTQDFFCYAVEKRGRRLKYVPDKYKTEEICVIAIR